MLGDKKTVDRLGPGIQVMEIFHPLFNKHPVKVLCGQISDHLAIIRISLRVGTADLKRGKYSDFRDG